MDSITDILTMACVASIGFNALLITYYIVITELGDLHETHHDAGK